MSNYHFTESVPTAFGMDDMDIYADMSAYELSDKLADLVDTQERYNISKLISIYRN